jgi:hypothetical protein
MTQQDTGPEAQALPAAVRITAPGVWYQGVPLAVGRNVACPDATTYQIWRNEGKCHDVAAADGQTLNQGTAVGLFTAPWNDSSGRLYPAGMVATITAADAAVARREGKIDANTLPAPALSAVSATALGAGSVRFNWTSDQVTSAKIEWGPTTAYAGGTVTAPTGEGVQSYTYGPIVTGVTHYRITLTSVWGTTVGTDQTVTVT